MKEFFVLQEVGFSKVARDKEAEEGEGGKDDVAVVEEVDNVVGVRGEGGNAEKQERERKPVLHLTAKWNINCVPIKQNQISPQYTHGMVFERANYVKILSFRQNSCLKRRLKRMSQRKL